MEEQQVPEKEKKTFLVGVHMKNTQGEYFFRRVEVEAEDWVEAQTLAYIKAMENHGDNECVIGD